MIKETDDFRDATDLTSFAALLNQLVFKHETFKPYRFFFPSM